MPSNIKDNHAVINEHGDVFRNAEALRQWEQWALAKVERAKKSRILSQEEAEQRINETLSRVRRSLD